MATADAADITDRTKMHQLFCALQKSRKPLSLVFHGNDQTYSTLLIESHLDKKRGYFLLDELIPRDGNQLAMKDTPFSITATLNGANLFFRVPKIQDAALEKDDVIYTVAFPEKLRYQQLRNAFRVHIPENLRTTAHLSASTRQRAIEGMLDDISASGCRLLVKGAIEPEPARNELFEEFYFKLPQQNEAIRCSAVLRRAVYDITRKTTSLGLEFRDLSAKHQSWIGRYVIAIELQNRRNKS